MVSAPAVLRCVLCKRTLVFFDLHDFCNRGLQDSHIPVEPILAMLPGGVQGDVQLSPIQESSERSCE